MTPDLEKSIIEKYPSLFANVGQKGSPMCFGLEVGDGWAGIISTMCWILNQRDTDKKFRFDQIKEKFGLLRAYHTGGSEYMAGVVRMAEDISGKTCEVCGQPGEQRKGGWIKTLCDRCHEGESQVSSQENLTPCPYVTGSVTRYCTLTTFTLTDEECEAIEYFSEWCIGPWERLKRYGATLRDLLSRTGKNSRQTCDEAAEYHSHGEKNPERDRLTDDEEDAVRLAYIQLRIIHAGDAAAALRGLLERLGGER